MGRNPGSSSSCKDHQWREGRGVCPSCLVDRLLSLTYSTSKSSELTTAKSLKKENSVTGDNFSSENSIFSTADASFSWQRCKSQKKGPNSKEYFFDAEDDQRLCLVYFDSDVDSGGHSQGGKIHKLGVDGSRKGKSHCARSSSLRIDAPATQGKQYRSLWAPSAILKRLLASTRSSMDRCTSHKQQKEEDDHVGVGGDGSDISRDSLRSEADKIHPIRRVIPLISTGCYDRFTETLKNSDQMNRFSYQCCSKGFTVELNRKPATWSKAMGRGSSPLRIFSRKSQEKEVGMDLDKQFQGAATSWSRSNALALEHDRKHAYLSPAHTLYYKDHSHSQCSFRSSPLLVRKCRRKKGLENRPGIFHISPFSLGNDGLNCYLSPLAYRRNSTVKHRLN